MTAGFAGVKQEKGEKDEKRPFLKSHVLAVVDGLDLESMKEKERDGGRGGSHQPVYNLPCLPDIRPLCKIDFLHHLCHIVRICTDSPSEPSRK